MKNTVFKILCAVLAIPMVAACYSLEDEQYAELSPITFNDVSSTIDVMAGDELVYDKLEVTSEFPVTYEWAYGPKKTTAATETPAEGAPPEEEKKPAKKTAAKKTTTKKAATTKKTTAAKKTATKKTAAKKAAAETTEEA